MVKKKKWVITTTGERPIADVRKGLTEAGFTVEQVLGEIGCITGAASDAVATRARSVPGVGDVSPDAPVDIGPPDSLIQ